MKKYILINLLIYVISSCVTPDKFQVTKIGEEPEIYIQRFIYGLPRTVIRVKINFEKETYIPGPYRMFSERLLGMTDFVSKAETKWNISGVNISGFNEPDPLHYYSVNLISGTFQYMQYLKLSREGLIIDPDQGVGIGAEKIVSEKIIEPPYFTNLSIVEIFNEVSDTLYKTIIRDSALIRTPVIRKLREVKTIDQKAEVAANFISEVRDLRYDLLSGDANVFNSGNALETAVKELDKMEKDYLSLFIGKRFTQKYSQSFIITPSGTVENLTLMKLSASKGIMPADSPEGESVTIEISPSGDTEVLKKNISQTPVKENYNTLYYRVPEVSGIRVVQRNKLLYESRFSICQAGSLMDIPVTNRETK
jgi:hypothetical protein